VLATDRLGLAVTRVATRRLGKGGASLLGATQGGGLVDAGNPSYIVAAGFTLAGLGLAAMGIVDSSVGCFSQRPPSGWVTASSAPPRGAHQPDRPRPHPRRFNVGRRRFPEPREGSRAALFGLGLFVVDP
jgi:hypothetical protein